MSKIQNVVAKLGEYQSGNETKAEWLTIGRLVTHPDGKQSIYLDAIPTSFNGQLYVFDRTVKPE